MNNLIPRNYSSLKDAVAHGANVGIFEHSSIQINNALIYEWRLRGDNVEFRYPHEKAPWVPIDSNSYSFKFNNVEGIQIDWSLPIQFVDFIEI